MRFRWRLVMMIAWLLRVKMYEHWSEQPAYVQREPEIEFLADDDDIEGRK